MAKTAPKSNRARGKHKLAISAIRYVSVPDAEARLIHAIDVLLRAATNTNSPPDETDNAPKGSHPDKRGREVKPDGV